MSNLHVQVEFIIQIPSHIHIWVTGVKLNFFPNLVISTNENILLIILALLCSWPTGDYNALNEHFNEQFAPL